MLGGVLKVTELFLGTSQNLPLQPSELLRSVSRQYAGLLLNPSSKVPEGAVDLVCVHVCLSLQKRSVSHAVPLTTRDSMV